MTTLNQVIKGQVEQGNCAIIIDLNVQVLPSNIRLIEAYKLRNSMRRKLKKCTSDGI